MVGVMGLSKDGLPFDTPDDRPVHCMVLLGTSPEQRDRHLQVLAVLARTVGQRPGIPGAALQRAQPRPRLRDPARRGVRGLQLLPGRQTVAARPTARRTRSMGRRRGGRLGGRPPPTACESLLRVPAGGPGPAHGASLATVSGPARTRAGDRHAQGRPHRHRHRQPLRRPDPGGPAGALPAPDHEARPLQVHRPRAAVVRLGRDERPLLCRRTASRSGTSGRTRTATWGRSTAASGGTGPRPGRPGEPEHIDQLAQVVEQIRTSPDSRRLVVSAWNAAELPAHGAAPVSPALPVLGGRRASSRAASTSAAATSSWASPSTSPRTRC